MTLAPTSCSFLLPGECYFADPHSHFAEVKMVRATHLGKPKGCMPASRGGSCQGAFPREEGSILGTGKRMGDVRPFMPSVPAA